jgi:hypothetical protein
MNEQDLAKIIATLEQSDIVWPRYGSDTIEELAKRILRELEQKND